jgi:hypothetical protein
MRLDNTEGVEQQCVFTNERCFPNATPALASRLCHQCFSWTTNVILTVMRRRRTQSPAGSSPRFRLARQSLCPDSDQDVRRPTYDLACTTPQMTFLTATRGLWACGEPLNSLTQDTRQGLVHTFMLPVKDNVFWRGALGNVPPIVGLQAGRLPASRPPSFNTRHRSPDRTVHR